MCDWSSIKCETKCGHVFVFQIFCDSNQWTETTHYTPKKQQSQFVYFPRVLFAKISQDWGLIFWKVVPNAGEEVSHVLEIVWEKSLGCFVRNAKWCHNRWHVRRKWYRRLITGWHDPFSDSLLFQKEAAVIPKSRQIHIKPKNQFA